MQDRKPHDSPSTSDMLEDIVATGEEDVITVFEIADSVSERGFGLLLLLFSLPSCIPIYIPFLPSIFAIPIMFFAVQMIIQKQRPWIPKIIGEKHITRKTLSTIILKATPILRKIEKVMHPRLRRLLDIEISEIILGILVLLFAISMTVPLPLTNFLPAIGVVLISLGLLRKDGLIALLGVAIGILGVAATCYVVLMGKQAISNLLGFF